MSKTIYRKAALERLSSPEQLDQTIPITNPRGWLVLGAMIALLLAAFFWGIFGTITTQVPSRAILINSGGIQNVVATLPGQITRMDPEIMMGNAESAPIVQAGQVVAWISDPATSEVHEVASTYTGRVLEIKAGEGDLVERGDAILSLEFIGDDVELEGVLYLSASEAGPIRPGMEVQFTPDSVPSEVSGYLVGSVLSVGDFPSSYEGLLRMLGSDELIQALSVTEAPIEIRFELLPDPDSPDGLQWSSTGGSPTGFRSGTLGTANIIVDERRPIGYLFSSD